MTPDSGPRSWPDRSSDYENHIGTKRSVNPETSTIIVGIGSCERTRYRGEHLQHRRVERRAVVERKTLGDMVSNCWYRALLELLFALMGPLKNSRHEKFAQAVASGLSGSEAYRQVVGAAAGKNADVIANQLMNQHGVRERIAELKEANSRKATLSREQTIEFLCNVRNDCLVAQRN
jgi:hypothetical protein